MPYIEEYAGVWAIRPREGLALRDAARSMNLSVHLQQVHIGTAENAEVAEAEQRRGREEFLLSPEGIAIVELTGTMTKHASSFSGGTSTVEARRQIRAAARSGDAKAIVLLIDSPGGSAKGTADLADDVRRARETSSKPVVAFVEDLAASAGYFVASQADEIVANQPEALVGSLGTFLVVYDMSKMAEDEGVKVHVISTGKFKGMGVPGSEITEEQLEELDREVKTVNESFLRAVQTGRGFSKAKLKEVFTGQVWGAREAIELGLVDSIETFDGLLARLSENPAGSGRTRRQEITTSSTQTPETATTMSEPTNTPEAPKAATIQEIRAACKGADEKFIVEQLEKNATLSQSMTAWMERQSELLAKAEADKQAAVEEAKKSAAKEETAAQRAARRGLGTTSLADDDADEAVSEYAGEAVGTMLARRNEIMRQRKCSPAQAMKVLARTDPDLLQTANQEYDGEFAGAYRQSG